MYFNPRNITEGEGKNETTIRITQSGKWVNVDVLNYVGNRVKNYGYNRTDKRWSYGEKPAADSLAWKVLTTNPAEEVKAEPVEAPVVAEVKVEEKKAVEPAAKVLTTINGQRKEGEVITVQKKDGAVYAGIAGKAYYDDDIFGHGHRGWKTEVLEAVTEEQKAACRAALGKEEAKDLLEAESRNLSLNNSIYDPAEPRIEFEPGLVTRKYDAGFAALGGRA